MIKRCDICRDSRTIRLPIYRSVTMAGPQESPQIEESARTFPCPQCGPTVPEERVGIVRHGVEYPARYGELENAMPHIKRSAAAALIDGLLRNGFITFETIKAATGDPFGISRIRATLAAVNPAHLVTMEARIAERQTEIAHKAAAIAIAEIDNWGSHFGHSEILKQDARRFITEAVRKAVQQDKAWRDEK